MVTLLWQWLSRKKHIVYLVAFLLIVIPSAALYPVAQQEVVTWICVLIFVIILGNILVISLD